MAEADLILGAVSLGIEAVKQLHWYCTTFRGAQGDITHLAAETGNIAATLSHLEHTLSGADAGAVRGWGEKDRKVVASAGEELKRNFGEIVEIIMPFVKLGKGGGPDGQVGSKDGRLGGWEKTILKAKYPGKSGAIRELTKRIEACKTTLSMAMDALNL